MAMKSTAIALLAACLGLCDAAKPPAKPNVLTMLTDDQGWGDNEYNCDNSTCATNASQCCAHTPHIKAFAEDPHTALLHRFYAAASVCSPTRAAYLTGRTNNRDCIDSALPCCSENVADVCSQGKNGGLPWEEFTIAKAAKKSKLGNYGTIQLGKWHLGDLWDKKLPGMSAEKWSVSDPGKHGFDDWMTTQAEASNSMTNCGCFHKNHSHPGRKPNGGYSDLVPLGDHCVVGSGFESDWCYPCTDYFYPNASDPRGVSALSETVKVPGDDSTFLIDRFELFLAKQISAANPWLAHICFHAIHEPHPAMPEFWDMYATPGTNRGDPNYRDPDYLGALTMWDVQIGRLMSMLKEKGVADSTAIFYTADNGAHQGIERADIHYSTGNLRQCKASSWEGGIRVPGMIHIPWVILENKNISTPTTTADFLPTIMSIFQVESDNPTWVMDGIDLIPLVQSSPTVSSGRLAADGAVAGYVPRSKPLGFDCTGGQHTIIDNNMKIIHNPGGAGQCSFQPPYSEWSNWSEYGRSSNESYMFLFDLDEDYHELHNLNPAAPGKSEPAEFERMLGLLNTFLASVNMSQHDETKCAQRDHGGPDAHRAPAGPAPPPRTDCAWTENTGQKGSDIAAVHAVSKEECCARCWADPHCAAADLAQATEKGGMCHLKGEDSPIARHDGSISCVPKRDLESRTATDTMECGASTVCQGPL